MDRARARDRRRKGNMRDWARLSTKERTELRVKTKDLVQCDNERQILKESNRKNRRKKRRAKSSRSRVTRSGEVRVKKSRRRKKMLVCQSLLSFVKLGFMLLQGLDIKFCESGRKQGIESSGDK